MILASKNDRYEISRQVAEASTYRLYLCRQESSGRTCLLQIATEKNHNTAMDLTVFYLNRLKEQSDRLEAEFEKVKEAPHIFLNYALGFPELVDSWICNEQGSRRINILAFRGIEDIASVVPISNITEKDGLRVDLRTSAWIMGKVLKLLVFAHDLGISIGNLRTTDILIQPEEHYVILFNWTDAKSNEQVPSDLVKQDISQATQSIITILGGNFENREFIDDGDPGFSRYTEFLLALADGKYTDAARAHKNFYELIDGIWERKFYPFTTHGL